MLAKYKYHGTLKQLIIMLFAATFVACTTTSTAPTEVEVSEPAIEVSATEPRVKDLPVAPAQHNVEFRASAPEQYTVVSGDTLWDLSNRFLVDPWYWPEIWYLNPQINNPHLIYPGDVVILFYVSGKPYLTVGDGPRITGAERLSPRIRAEDIGADDYGIPIQAIQQFITRPRVVSEETLDSAPYIVGSQEERLAYGSGDRVYVRGFEGDPESKYTVFRKCDDLVDPKSGELLGYEAIMVGDGDIVRVGDPATLDLSNTNREALRGDRLLPSDFTELDTEFVPHAPDADIRGNIISLFDALSQVGQFQVITLNLGDRDGIEKGHVFAVNQAGRVIADPFTKPGSLVDIQLPEESIGIAMVFRTFEKVSYALIMETTRAIQIGDSVTRP